MGIMVDGNYGRRELWKIGIMRYGNYGRWKCGRWEF